jgi:hypothetical protein
MNEDEDLEQMVGDHGPDLYHVTISGLSEPTPCALIHIVVGYQAEVGWGQVYPRQFELYTVLIHEECAVVKVELVSEWHDIVLPFPPNDEISKLGEALLQRIEWQRRDIVVRQKQPSSQTVAKDITRGASDASKTIVPSKEPAIATKSDTISPPKEPAGAKKSAPITDAAKTIVPSKEPSTVAKSDTFSPPKEPAGAKKSAPITDASKTIIPSKEPASAPNSTLITAAAKSAPITAAAKSTVGTTDDVAKSAADDAISAGKNVAAGNNVAVNSRPKKRKLAESSKKAPSEGSKKKQQPIKSSKHQPKKKGSASAWTQDNPHYRYGLPMLIADEPKSAGPATTSLHNHYLKGCAAKKKAILVQYKHCHFQQSQDTECLLVGFNDLYDLFNVDAFNVLLIR